MRKVTLLRFSHRQAGNCAAIAAHIRDRFPVGTVSEFIMDGDICKPCQNCDYQCLRGEGVCPHQNVLYFDAMNAIMASELVYFTLPNYWRFPLRQLFCLQ